MHVPSCYDKNQIPPLTPTQLVFFEEVQIEQFNGPPTTSRVKKYNVFFQEMKKGKFMWKEVFIIQTFDRKGQPLSMINMENFVLA